MRTWTVFGGAALTLVLALGQASLQMLWMRGGMPLQARFIAASPVSDSVVVGGDSWGVWVYRLSTGLLERFVPTLSSPRAMVFSPSGEYLATADGVWRLADWSLVSQ
ncbi:MAG: hypothetical protein N2651_06130, partial [Fimbriimonadales bacterium]|nr:hypothetical protein [Fimbriimonadales bacterium]